MNKFTNKNTYLFFDTETTGLPKDFNALATDYDNWPRLVQIAWIVTSEIGTVLSNEEYVIKPEGFIIPDDAIEIHGISNSVAMEEGWLLGYVLSKFWDVVRNAGCVVCHNVQYDENIVAAEFFRAGMSNAFNWKTKLDTKIAGTDLCKIPNPKKAISGQC